MENFDREKAARVWQRVIGREPAAGTTRQDSGELLHQSHTLAGLYLGLSRQLTGQAALRAKGLHRQHRELTACLKGMYLAARESVPGLAPMTPGSGRVRDILESCLHRERRLGAGLSARSGDPEHGPVFQLLAGQAVARAVAVLELLGEIQGQDR